MVSVSVSPATLSLFNVSPYHHFQRALARPSRRKDLLPSAYLYLAKVAKQLNDEATLKYAVSGAISPEAGLGGDAGAASEALSLLSK